MGVHAVDFLVFGIQTLVLFGQFLHITLHFGKVFFQFHFALFQDFLHLIESSLFHFHGVDPQLHLGLQMRSNLLFGIFHHFMFASIHVILEILDIFGLVLLHSAKLLLQFFHFGTHSIHFLLVSNRIDFFLSCSLVLGHMRKLHDALWRMMTFFVAVVVTVTFVTENTFCWHWWLDRKLFFFFVSEGVETIAPIRIETSQAMVTG
mmetsp:Transcript_5231/g.12515  ORF Transcript_5231/g.12515 Transcript_5231/m.12515 type:complete len:205 (-) Transcript_5231:1065-1679(-)